MFPGTEVSLLLIPAIAVFAIAMIFARVKLAREDHPARKLARHIHYTVWMAGGFFVYLWFLLPSGTLSSFGYPKTVDDVESPQKILRYLQWYNRDIVRTVEVVHWAMFLGVFLVGASLEAALREFRAKGFGAVIPVEKSEEKA